MTNPAAVTPPTMYGDGCWTFSARKPKPEDSPNAVASRTISVRNMD
jgi:hypothetical protein